MVIQPVCFTEITPTCGECWRIYPGEFRCLVMNSGSLWKDSSDTASSWRGPTSLHSRLSSLVEGVLGIGQPWFGPDHHGNLQLVGTLPLGEHRVKEIRYLKHQSHIKHQSDSKKGRRWQPWWAWTSCSTCFLTAAGSMLGTCLMENLAVTLAGMTVLVPESEKAPSMPWMDTVGYRHR